MTVHAFDFLEETESQLPGICIIYGDEAFLKRLVLGRIRQAILGVNEDVPFAELAGATCEWRDVADELTTVSLFGGSTRLVIVSEADDFVSNHRSQLETLAAKPPSSGTLALVVKSWPGNTRLAKKLPRLAWPSTADRRSVKFVIVPSWTRLDYASGFQCGRISNIN